jgi:hypothetical protein
MVRYAIRFFSLIFIGNLIASCATVHVNKLKEYPPKPLDCELDVYMIADDIKRPHEEICILESLTGTNLFSKKTFEQAIKLAKPKACECGADAILVSSVDKQGVNLLHWGQGRAVVRGLKYE